MILLKDCGPGTREYRFPSKFSGIRIFFKNQLIIGGTQIGYDQHSLIEDSLRR